MPAPSPADSRPNASYIAGMDERAAHWDAAYASKGEAGVSWFEENPDVSVGLIERFHPEKSPSVIDIGGGASRLVDAGLGRGWAMTVLDISAKAVETARQRLGSRADAVDWIVADATVWQPQRLYDVWHDRAAFHFLTSPGDRQAYLDRLRTALRPGGHAIIATFAPDGPERCSGLPVERYDADRLAATVGDGFAPVAALRRLHRTPWGSEQAFQYVVLRRDGD